MKIGFIGLGIMGSRMAKNLQKAGFDLIVYNRDKTKAEAIESEIAQTVEQVGAKSDVVITMLSTPQVVEKLASEFLPQMKEDAWWIDCSTVNPSFSRLMAKKAAQHNLRFVDAPVAGSKAPAESGELLFLAGGKEAALYELTPLFEAMGKKTLYLNDVGNGANVKMLINLLLAQSMTAFSEAISLGKNMGLNESLLLNILTSTPVVAPFLGAIKPQLEAGSFDVNFPLKWILKDINLALDTANEVKTNMASLTTTKSLFENAMEKGFGDEDFSAIYKSV